MKAKAILGRAPKGMNGTEYEYSQGLEARQRTGTIVAWRFAAVTLQLAPDCRYTPDFLVILPEGTVELREIKGFWRDDAKVKIRVAARLFPWFTFRAYRRVRGAWETEEFAP